MSASRIYSLSALGVSLLFVAIFAFTPYAFDDYNYAVGAAGLSPSVSRAAVVWDSCVYHWLTDTGRFCNLLNVFFLGLFPKWVFSVLSGCFVWLSLMLMPRIARIGQGAWQSWLLLAAYVFVLPWFDFMFTVVFAINYLWPSALVLAYLYCLFDRRYCCGRGKFALWCLLAFFTGWMHEGFSVPVIAGLCAAYLYERRVPGGRELMLVTAFVAGAAMIAVAPSFWLRVGKNLTLFNRFSYIELILNGIVFNGVYITYVLALFYVLSIGAIRRRVFSTGSSRVLTVFIFVSTAVASIIYYKYYTGPRMAWYGTQFGMTGLAVICSTCSCRRVFNLIVGWFVAVAVFTHLVMAVVKQIPLYQENERITELYLDSPDGCVYFDATPERADMTLLKTSVRVFNEHIPTQGFSNYWRPDGPVLSLLPSALAGFDGESASACESDASLKLYGGLLLSSAPVSDESAKIMVLIPGTGWTESRLRYRRFSDSAGRDWYLIMPHTVVMTGAVPVDARWVK